MRSVPSDYLYHLDRDSAVTPDVHQYVQNNMPAILDDLRKQDWID